MKLFCELNGAQRRKAYQRSIVEIIVALASGGLTFDESFSSGRSANKVLGYIIKEAKLKGFSLQQTRLAIATRLKHRILPLAYFSAESSFYVSKDTASPLRSKLAKTMNLEDL